ncbi:MAG: ABC transporter substrate-binding protein, partial [Bdellovibrionota bacterium]
MKRFLVSLLVALSLAACTTRHADEGRVLNLVLGDDVKSLDPASAYDSVSLTVMPLALESLFQYKYTKLPLELEPLLAEGMPAISKDLKTFTITLKKGVMWQDDAAFPGGKGRELKAQDFIYAWKRMLLPNIQSPGTWMFDGKVVGWDDYRKRLLENRAEAEKILDEPVAGLLATDDYTLQIKLLQPYPQLMHVLAMGFGAPVAKEVIAKYGQEGLNNRMVGTGPFRLVQFTKGSKVVLERSPTFRGENYPSDGDEDAKNSGLLQSAGLRLPFVDKVTFNIIKEDQPAWLQFRKGNLDAAGVPKDSFSSAIDAGDLRPELKTQGVKLRKAEE